jgi:hypothetical protein
VTDTVHLVETPEPLFFVITVLWGTICGLVGGRFPDERRAVARAMGIGAILGGLSYVWARSSTTEPAWASEAAVALGLGCSVALVLLLAFGQRPRQTD